MSHKKVFQIQLIFVMFKNVSITLKLSKIGLPVNLIGIREVPFPAITICPSVNSKWKAIGEILQNLEKNDSIVKTFNQFPRDFKVNGCFSLFCFYLIWKIFYFISKTFSIFVYINPRSQGEETKLMQILRKYTRTA